MSFQFGTMGNYLKQMNLQTKWNLKKMGMPTQTLSEAAALERQAAAARKALQVDALTGKLKAGQRLTASEMAYLKENAPELYRKARRIEAEREEFRKDLERCRTREEAADVHNNKINQFANEASSITKSGMSAGNRLEALEFIEMRMAAVENEYLSFMGTRGARLSKSKETDTRPPDPRADFDEIARDPLQALRAQAPAAEAHVLLGLGDEDSDEKRRGARADRFAEDG